MARLHVHLFPAISVYDSGGSCAGYCYCWCKCSRMLGRGIGSVVFYGNVCEWYIHCCHYRNAHYGMYFLLLHCSINRQNPKDPLLARQWIRALLYPQAAKQGWPFGAGPRLPCLACTGNHAKLQDLDASSHPSGLTGTLQSVRLRDRLSVSVFATRRGINADHTRSLGRTTFFDCLVVLINLVYQPQFVVCFLYHATLIHFEDKAARGKSTIFLTDHGFVSASG